MKKNPLQIYLHDHLAGAALAIDMLSAMGGHHPDIVVARFARELLAEIKEDHVQLQQLASRIETHSAGFKEILARIMEKMSRLKLRRTRNDALGTFESFEALSLGILGKKALWTALGSVEDPRLEGLDYMLLVQRAREQHARVERMRLELAPRALQG